MVHNMNTRPALGADLTNAQAPIQMFFLIIVSFTAAWLSVYRVPWQVSGDPCLLAAGATVVIVTCLWLTRRRGLPGLNSERNLLAGFLVGMPLVYVSRYLFASTGRMANYWFWIEVLGTAIFVALAVLGLKRSPWFLAIGIVAHGLAWDTWHYRNSTYIPDWYATSCPAVDLTFGAYVAASVRAYQSASHIEIKN